MYILSRHLLPFLSVLLITSAMQSPLNGQTNDSTLYTYLGALEQTERQQKEIILWFGAQWCSSCQNIQKEWLQEQAWMGPLRKGYIHAWIDVDDFDGYILKEQFDIDQLPTVILLSSNGKPRAKRHKAWNKNAFVQWLQQHRMNAKPTDNHRDKQSEAVSEATDQKKSDVLDPHYRVQVGVFSTEDRAGHRAEEIELKTGIQVVSQEEINDGKRVYKLLTKKFEDKELAVQAMDKLNSYGIDGFVRTLTGTRNI